MRRQALFLLLLTAASATAAAPQSTLPIPAPPAPRVGADTLRLKLVDGTTIYGSVREVRGDTVRIALLSGDALEVQHARIREIEPFRGRVVGSQVWETDANETRLFFGPTGRSLRSGSGYFAMYYAVMPFVAVAAGDRVTLAGGTPLWLGPDMTKMFWLAPKVEVVRSDNVRAAVGVLSFFVDGETFGVLYSVATLGRSSDAAVTLGAGYGYVGGDVGNTPALLGGGERRVSRSVKLVSENYIFPSEGVLLSAGPRFMGSRLTADLAMVTFLSGDGIPGVAPFVNFVFNW